jgi:hypothetical protein
MSTHPRRRVTVEDLDNSIILGEFVCQTAEYVYELLEERRKGTS